MKKFNTNNFLFIIILFTSAVIFTSCVNYEQKTKLNEDGSGSMKIHYWTSMKNFSMGSTIGKFEFEESKAKEKFTSKNTEITKIEAEEKLDDSTKHVKIELNFKDINKLTEAKGFENITSSWKEVSDGMELKYTLQKDTSAASGFDAGNYTITYEFEMPNEIVSTNGIKDGQIVKFSKTTADLKEDIDMIIVVKKSKGKVCGLLGFISAALFISFVYFKQKNML
jgi:hypothetical protein